GARTWASNGDYRVTELPLRRRSHRSAQRVGHQLHPVTDAEHRHADVEERRITERRTWIGYAFRSSRQDHAGRISRRDSASARARRPDLGINRELPQAARNKLRVLRA